MAPQPAAVRPTGFDMRARWPPVHAQRGLQSCAALAACDALWWAWNRAGDAVGAGGAFTPSALFVYYNARRRSGRENQNCPVLLDDVQAALAEDGVCREEAWPYDLRRYRERPPPPAYAEARGLDGLELRPLPQERAALAARLAAAMPFIFCLRLFGSNCWSFEHGETAATGRLALPRDGDPPVRNHALLAVGYDDAEDAVVVRNSLGAAWGQAGYGLVPWAYVLGRASAYAFWGVDPAVRKDCNPSLARLPKV